MMLSFVRPVCGAPDCLCKKCGEEKSARRRISWRKKKARQLLGRSLGNDLDALFRLIGYMCVGGTVISGKAIEGESSG